MRESTGLPVWAKLTSCVADLVSIARACAEAGADAVTAVNTIPGMAVDVGARRPVLAAVTGGLSGPAIRPVALRCVWEIARAVDVPVIGCGGIASADDAVAFLLAGASAIQVGTATFRDPRAPWRILEEITEWCEHEGVRSLSEIIGVARRAQ